MQVGVGVDKGFSRSQCVSLILKLAESWLLRRVLAVSAILLGYLQPIDDEKLEVN